MENEFYSLSVDKTISILRTDSENGLTNSVALKRQNEDGLNVLTKQKNKGFFAKVFDALKEPMLVILIFGFIIAFGCCLGEYFKTGKADFSESVGIFVAILISVSITLVMEGSSEKAFKALSRIYDHAPVKVIRDGSITIIDQKYLCVGDIVCLESGDKIYADGRIIYEEDLSVNESALTGESGAVYKNIQTVKQGTPLAERKNYVYSGTFVCSGNGKMVVCGIGDNTEIGKIAGELKGKEKGNSPLQDKLSKLGKRISVIGTSISVLVFLICFARLLFTGSLTFTGIRELFISCVVLIVATVPEGLPTIVAISLALNMIKLAKDNALIKKMVATETAGAVSVICSDKTGTLTQNEMKVVSVCSFGGCIGSKTMSSEYLYQNFCLNSTADITYNGEKKILRGSRTECALLEAINDSKKTDYSAYRNKYKIESRLPFSSEKKFMLTQIAVENKYRILIKGAPEIVLGGCLLSQIEREKINNDIKLQTKQARRVICFAHKDFDKKQDIDNVKKEEFYFDGFASIEDPIREEVYSAVKDCKRAGIKIKILTGDSIETAYAVASKIGVAIDKSSVVNAKDIENLSEEELINALKKINVIARSTPIIKLKVVKALKRSNEVVAVTGDGINDAPAIKNADIGIAMGISGSEITKESADVILLDDSFATVVKAISFGRNVYKNLQRFILFQLSVNVSALLFITLAVIMGLDQPFNTLQLLWINLIMDGPPALTLGLEKGSSALMNCQPVKKEQSIVSKKMLIRILVNGIIIGLVMIFQYLYNFLGIKDAEKKSAIFTIFIMFQLFNAFNCRELGSDSIFLKFNSNKIMVGTFLGVMVLHIIIVQFLYAPFMISPMSFISWIKCILICSTIVAYNELYKGVYRFFVAKSKNEKGYFLKIREKAFNNK